MTLKEELEILRGEPIEVFTGDPLDIPCIETSDAERLCKNPVVSVCMVTYNHEAYIRQAIEGVMMQKTDFEFELVIGEDCSSDKTREICFEYQKKYPDKIRVLWWHENLYKLNHPAGLNFERTSSHCRGEFMAICEGDDYWIDPFKLQKQVDVMRKHPNVGFCFCGAKVLDQSSGIISIWNNLRDGFQPGLINSQKYMLWSMFGRNPHKKWGSEFWQMTATFMVRMNLLASVRKEYEIFKWRLSVGDSILCLGCAAGADVYYLLDNVAMYRRANSGATCSSNGKCAMDTMLVRMYYANKVFGLQFNELPSRFVDTYVEVALSYVRATKGWSGVTKLIGIWRQTPFIDEVIKKSNFLVQRILGFAMSTKYKLPRLISLYRYFVLGSWLSSRVVELYSDTAEENQMMRCRYRRSIFKRIFKLFE